ncbi:hypothetical protein H5T53_00165 [Candidatus Bipolaricaulota bacterium]|nr:hypothetical protein [Candidatus Bipolaricaulota bacterium]
MHWKKNEAWTEVLLIGMWVGLLFLARSQPAVLLWYTCLATSFMALRGAAAVEVLLPNRWARGLISLGFAGALAWFTASGTWGRWTTDMIWEHLKPGHLVLAAVATLVTVLVVASLLPTRLRTRVFGHSMLTGARSEGTTKPDRK